MLTTLHISPVVYNPGPVVEKPVDSVENFAVLLANIPPARTLSPVTLSLHNQMYIPVFLQKKLCYVATSPFKTKVESCRKSWNFPEPGRSVSSILNRISKNFVKSAKILGPYDLPRKGNTVTIKNQEEPHAG